MSVRRTLSATVAAVALTVTSLLMAPPTAAEEGPVIRYADAATAVPGRYIVALRDTAVLRERGVAAVVRDLVERYDADLLHTYTSTVPGFAVGVDAATARRLAAEPAVDYVQADQRVTLSATQRPTPSWGLDRVDQRALPLNSAYTSPTTASNVHAYVIDTGLRITHNDFGGRAVHGYDFVNNDPVAEDCNGHGTHVAGTVGGTAYGVAKGVQLVGVRVFDCSGSAFTTTIAAAVDWVTRNAVRPAVVNMSLGGPADSYLDSVVGVSIGSGLTYTLAAGNEDADACGSSPARVAAAVTVGATTRTDARASFSNRGPCLDLFAPGDGITSTWYTNNSATAVLSGTSMAAPHVAGAAALYLARNTGATPQQVRDHLVTTGTSGKVTNPGSGSPNRLLYVQDAGATWVAVPRAADFDGNGADDLGLRRNGVDFFLDYTLDGGTERSFTDQTPYWPTVTVAGDFDGNGTDDVAHRSGNLYPIDTDLDGLSDLEVTFGRSTDLPFVADVDGDGRDDLGVRRGTTYYLDTTLDGVSDRTVTWGRSSDGPLLGDFDGNGTADLALRRGTTYYVDLDLNGASDRTLAWGRSTDLHAVGDFDGNGADDLALRRDATFYVDLDLDGGAEDTVTYGRASDAHLIGDFDGNGADDLGLRRNAEYFLDYDLNGATDRTVVFGRATDTMVVRLAS